MRARQLSNCLRTHDPEGIPAFDPIELRRYFTERENGKLVDPAAIIARHHIEGAGNNG